jgi:hypothetical protein
MLNECSSYYFSDAQRRFYLVKDVVALGDCAILAPLCKAQEPCCAVISPRSEECCQVYSLLRAVAAAPFKTYLEQVLQPRFWVGTGFFSG